MDKMLADILDNARRIRSEKGHILPVGILDLDGRDTGIVGLNLSTDMDSMVSMAALGKVAKMKGCQRAFVVQEVAMVIMTKEEMQNRPPPPRLEDLPLDDQKHALFVAELWFNEPHRSISVLQEFRFLGRAQPEYKEPFVNRPWVPNGLCVPALDAYHGRMEVAGLEITEQEYGEPGLPDTIDLDEIRDILGQDESGNPLY